MSEEADFEGPAAAEHSAPAWERGVWCATLLACTTPFQAILDEGGRPGTTILASAAAVVAMALLYTRGRPGSAFRLAVAAWPYLLVIALTGAFALGAVDPHWSLVRWLTWTPCIVVAFCAAARLPASQFSTVVLATLVAATILSAATAVIAPRYGVMGAGGVISGEASAGAWSGVYRTKNVLGHVAGIGVALLIGLGPPILGRTGAIVGAVAAGACLVMARSASGVAIAVLLAGFCLLVLRGRGVLRITALAALPIAGLAALLGGQALLDPAAALLGRDATLSGRTAIWRAAEPYVMQQPVTGSGYDYTGSPEFAGRLLGLFDVYSVHSGYLDGLITLGFGLSALTLAAVALALRRAWRGPVWCEERRSVSTALLIGGLLSAGTEAGITHPSGPMQMLWLLGLFGLYASDEGPA